jgi:predicted small secreted protein
MKKLIVVLVAALVTAGCNTMSGLGKDIERTGEKIQDKAKK